jgi:L-amino acid N-acyltransferase YncA
VSVGLHKKFGFEQVAMLNEVGQQIWQKHKRCYARKKTLIEPVCLS